MSTPATASRGLEGVVAANTRPSVVEATQEEYANTFMGKLRVFFEL